MKLFLSGEVQTNNTEIFYKILKDTVDKLYFICNDNEKLEELNNYGTEFKEISIITIIVSDKFLDLGFHQERRLIKRKDKEADIRLQMNYKVFYSETPENQRLLYIKNIIDSINVVIEKSKGDFRGEELKKDILNALNVTQEQLDRL